MSAHQEHSAKDEDTLDAGSPPNQQEIKIEHNFPKGWETFKEWQRLLYLRFLTKCTADQIPFRTALEALDEQIMGGVTHYCIIEDSRRDDDLNQTDEEIHILDRVAVFQALKISLLHLPDSQQSFEEEFGTYSENPEMSSSLLK